MTYSIIRYYVALAPSSGFSQGSPLFIISPFLYLSPAFLPLKCFPGEPMQSNTAGGLSFSEILYFVLTFFA